MKRSVACVVALAFLSGCAPARPMVVRSYEPANLKSADTSLALPVLAQTTTIERDYVLSKEDESAKADAENDEKLGKLYYAGLGVGAVGGLLAGGFTIASFVNDRNLENGYKDGMTNERHDQLSRRGKINNAVAWSSLAIGLVGFATAAAIFGESFRQCGSLAKKRRKCSDAAPSTK